MKDIDYLTGRYLNSYLKSFDRLGEANFMSFRPIPSMTIIEDVVEDLMELLFPGRSGRQVISHDEIRSLVKSLMSRVGEQLQNQIFFALYHENPLNLADDQTDEYHTQAYDIIEKLFECLPQMRIMMKQDAQAAYDGDPAATSTRETIISYPGVRAITMHRVAHFLYENNVPLVPRMISETVHKQTGIDIHPGAHIGENFFIDHGTGVVIGETTVIGNNVKLYQGVTLGALSFPKDERGALIRGTKRHPTLCDGVTVYANAIILGDVTIGEHTVIGSNTWIRTDIPPSVMVQNEEAKTLMRERKKRE